MPKQKFVRVDEQEYEALKELRDGVHEQAVIALKHAEANYAGCNEINKAQVYRIQSQDLELNNLRQENLLLQRKLGESEKRRRELEPATLGNKDTGAEVLFSKDELRRTNGAH